MWLLPHLHLNICSHDIIYLFLNSRHKFDSASWGCKSHRLIICYQKKKFLKLLPFNLIQSIYFTLHFGTRWKGSSFLSPFDILQLLPISPPPPDPTFHLHGRLVTSFHNLFYIGKITQILGKGKYKIDFPAYLSYMLLKIRNNSICLPQSFHGRTILYTTNNWEYLGAWWVFFTRVTWLCCKTQSVSLEKVCYITFLHLLGVWNDRQVICTQQIPT